MKVKTIKTKAKIIILLTLVLVLISDVNLRPEPGISLGCSIHSPQAPC